MLQIDRAMAIEHLSLLGYSEGDTVYLRAIPGKGLDGPVRKGTGIFPDLPWDKLEAFQAEGKGIYFVVNGQGDVDSAVATCNSLFFEHDDLDKEIQAGLWESIGLPRPTVQVETRKSIHSYWRIDSIAADHWRSVQTDLLEFANADRSLKNPSRVMRLAGCWHIKHGEFPMLCKIISQQAGVTDLATIEALVKPLPLSNIVAFNPIPLERCLTKTDRDLIARGEGEGYRNASGAKLARNLIATQDYLMAIGQRFDGEGRDLFNQFCQRCTPPIDAKESDQIWRSASKSNPSPSLSDEAISNCIKAWQRQTDYAPEADRPQPKTEKAKPENPSDQWQDFKDSVLELQQISDRCEREFKLRLVCSKYKMPVTVGKDLLQAERDQASNIVPVDVVEFLANKQSDREWLLAGHIPLGSVINLCAMGGTGKTTLVYELSKAIALGKDWNEYPTLRSKVMIIQSDEPETDTQEKLDIQSFYDLPPNTCFICFKWFSNIEKLAEFIKLKNIKFIVIDSLAAINIGMDRDKSEFSDILRVLRDVATEQKCTFLILDHTNKAGGNLGTVAVHNAVSEMLYLKFPTEDEQRKYLDDQNKKYYRILSWEKSRVGMRGTKYVLRQVPKDYSNKHLGHLESLVNGEPPNDSTEKTLIKHLKQITPQHNFTVSECARSFGLTYDDAEMMLESLRRTGLASSTWVVPEIGNKVGQRWRVYHAKLPPPKEPEPPIDASSDVDYTYEITYEND